MQHLKLLHGIYSQIRNFKPPYPGLKHKIDGGKKIWDGPLSFTARFDSIRVKDTFEIRIELPAEPEGFPLVRETSGRIDKMIFEGKAENSSDLHVNPDGTICLCPKPEEKRKFPGKVDLSKFIQELVIPYFFALHRFEKTGKWIWGQYSHGATGILEYYLERRNNGDPKLLADCLAALGFTAGRTLNYDAQVNGRERCICGSGAKFKKCHPIALAGLKAIIENVRKSSEGLK